MSAQLRVLTIDCQYVGPEFAAAYLLIAEDDHVKTRRAAFVDNNTSLAVPLLLKTLTQEGLAPADVQALIVTHVHLDHAAGTSELLSHCTNAQVLAHPRAVPHLIEPGRLVRSAMLVYGAETFKKLYGTLHPIEASRVIAMAHDQSYDLGGVELRFLHTRGHANHHFCIWAPAANTLFTGDAFGLSYPALQKEGTFVFPSTSPTEFDGPEALKTIELLSPLLNEQSSVYPTHFGKLSRPLEAAKQLRAWILTSMGWLDEAQVCGLRGVDLADWLLSQMLSRYQLEANRLGLSWGEPQWELIKLDLKLNAQGLAYIAEKQRGA